MNSVSEPRFIVYDDETPIKYKEGRLVRAIKAGELDGDELFRREDEAETALRPLHQSLLFQRVHGVDGLGAARMVDANKVRSFSQHVTSFASASRACALCKSQVTRTRYKNKPTSDTLEDGSLYRVSSRHYDPPPLVACSS